MCALVPLWTCFFGACVCVFARVLAYRVHLCVSMLSPSPSPGSCDLHNLIFIIAIKCSAERVGPHWASISPPLEKCLLCVCSHVCVRQKQKEKDAAVFAANGVLSTRRLSSACLLLQPGSRSHHAFLCRKCCLLSLLCLYSHTVTISPSDRPSLEGKRKTGKRETEAEKQRCRQKNAKNRWIDE